MRANEIWAHLIETQVDKRAEHAAAAPMLRSIVNEGCLARRIARAAGPRPSTARLHEVYARLADCLAQDRFFSGDP